MNKPVKILISSDQHPIYHMIRQWGKYDELALKKDALTPGGNLFLISCSEIIDAEFRKKFDKVFVLHAADLPKGRGWSPHIWQVIEGARQITLTLLEAADKVDSGDIYGQTVIDIDPGDLHDDINRKLFEAELKLIENIGAPRPQVGEPTYYRKRTPEDSKLDVDKSLREQFDLIRVCDPDRFPAFFELHGKKYKIKLEKM